MRGVRVLKTKTVVSIPALQIFLEAFDTELIDALVTMVEFGKRHPDFGKPGHPGDGDYEGADLATDVLYDFFDDPDFVEDVPEHPPRVTVDFRRATITLRNAWYSPPSKLKRKPVPDLRRAVDRIPLRIMKRRHSKN